MMSASGQRDLLSRAISRFGAHRQIDKCVEELGELATALMKFRWESEERASAKDVAGELADVQITIDQVKLIIDEDAYRKIYDEKLNRLATLVEAV